MNTKLTRLLYVCGIVAVEVLLAGCSATHVGESWQCPLAQGTSCTTIADADPAVPAGAHRAVALFGQPLHGGRSPTDRAAANGRRHQEEACDRDCGPLAWLGELFGAASAPTAPATVAATEPVAGPGGEAPFTEPSSAIAADESLRAPEVLGRIWIAPFVDSDGIYREAHWVRAVLEPAGWRLP